MKAYMVIGFWMLNPSMTVKQYEEMRKTIQNYVMFTPEAQSTFKALLDISEPSGQMKDCLIYKCIKERSPVIEKITTPNVTEFMDVPLNTWPFPNYCKRIITFQKGVTLEEYDM